MFGYSVLTCSMTMNLGLARTMRDHFNVRFTRKTQVKRLQGVDDEDLYEVADSQTDLKGKTVSGEKSKRGKKYKMNGASERNTNVLGTRADTWKRIMAKGRRQAKSREETVHRYSPTTTEKDGGNVSYFKKRDSCKKWNTETGKEIKSEPTQPVFLELFDTCQSLFVNELAPPTPATLYGRQSCRQPRDLPGILLEEAGNSGISTNHVTLNVSAGKAWKDTRKNSELFDTSQSLFVNELAPPTTSNLYGRQSCGQSCDLAIASNSVLPLIT